MSQTGFLRNAVVIFWSSIAQFGNCQRLIQLEKITRIKRRRKLLKIA